jgi:hypothetical protein
LLLFVFYRVQKKVNETAPVDPLQVNDIIV